MRPADRLRRIEVKREELLVRLSTLEPSVLAACPLPGKWSIAEIIEHLVISEVDVVGDFFRLADLEEGFRSPRHRALCLVVMCVLRFDIPVKVPSKAMKPVGGRSLGELGTSWKENHSRLRAFVAALDTRGAKRAIFRHPVAGPISVTQGMLMLELHLDRHIRQIRRLEHVLGRGGPGTVSR